MTLYRVSTKRIAELIADKVDARLAPPRRDKALTAELVKLAQTPVSEDELRDSLASLFGPEAVWIGDYAGLARELGHHTLRAWLSQEPARAAVYLTRWTESYGHWTTVFLQNNGRLQFFDSTAHAPDTLAMLQSLGRAQRLGQSEPILVEALRGRPAFYNDEPLQADGAQTCGRWCLLRLAVRDMSEPDFADWVEGLARDVAATPDLVVTAATAE